MAGRRGRGLAPTTQDLVAIAIIGLTYLTRIATLGEPAMTAPWWLTLTTDLLLPTLAGTWLFVAAMFVLIVRVGNLE